MPMKCHPKQMQQHTSVLYNQVRLKCFPPLIRVFFHWGILHAKRFLVSKFSRFGLSMFKQKYEVTFLV